MGNFELTKMAVNMFCPGNVVQLDDAGLPSILVYIPAFKLSDVLTGGDDSLHPAFIVNGKAIPGFYFSKYQNVVHNGKAYSLPAEDPKTSTFGEGYESCHGKGYGWHMSTAAEWAAIALWCKKNGFVPYGNNGYGKDSRESNYKAIPTYYDPDGNIGRVATGTGPLTWSHDRTVSGIWDMNGNVWEWLSGLRIVWGEVQILANNDAADPDNPINETSTCWKAIDATTGAFVDPESKTTDTAVKSSGKTVKLDYLNNVWTYTNGISNASQDGRSCTFSAVTCAASVGNAAKVVLQSLALLPDEGAMASEYEADTVWWTNGVAERFVNRGGRWGSNATAGLFCLSNNTRESTGQGFRAAYIPNI